MTILEVLPQLLPALDGDAVAVLLEQSQRIGIHIETGVRIERIEHSDGPPSGQVLRLQWREVG